MRAHEFIVEVGIGAATKRRAEQQYQQRAANTKTPSRADLAKQAGFTGSKGGASYYKGFKCTKDCSGHRAGYAWAARKNISSTNQMPTGNSNSFWEGGKSYALGR